MGWLLLKRLVLGIVSVFFFAGQPDARANQGETAPVWGVMDMEYLEGQLRKAEGGDVDVQIEVASIFYHGHGLEQDYSKALGWFLRAAEQGAVKAKFYLGFMYHEGHGVAQNYAEAARWWRKAAEQGQASAMERLGFLYRDGLGVPQDRDEAGRWSRKSRETRDAEIERRAADAYQRTLRSLSDIAKLGDSRAILMKLMLGRKYHEGRSFPKDLVQAYKWLELAYAEGDEGARFERDAVAEEMTPDQIAEAQGLAGAWRAQWR